MKNIKAIFFIIILSIALTEQLWAAQSPVTMLENTANQIIASLQQNQSKLKSNHNLVYQAISRYLLPNVDVDGMSRSVLGRAAWMKATSAEKQAFTKEFTQLVIRTYGSPLAEYKGETVKFLPMRAPIDGRFARVNSVISRPNGQNIPLSYNLVSKSGQWKIYDLSVEGVSLLQSFRTQFGQVLQNSSMSDLIAQMKKKERAA